MNRMTYLLALGLLSVLCFSGCIQDPKPGSEPTDVTFKNTDNTVRVRLPVEPDRLNPLITSRSVARPIYEEIFPALLQIEPNGNGWLPFLAENLPTINVAGEGMSYTYRIRPEAKWPDGKPVTPADYIFSLKILFNYSIPADAQRVAYNKVINIETYEDDPQKLTVYASEPIILTEPALNTLNLYPKHIFDADGLMDDFSIAELTSNGPNLKEEANLQAFAEQFMSAPYSRDKAYLIGAGAYELTKWEDGQYISLRKKDNWWGEPLVADNPHMAAYPDSLVFSIISDNATAVAAIKNESIDLATDIDAQDFIQMQELDFVTDRYSFETPDRVVMFFLGLNMRDPILSDKRVRRALAHLVNTDEILNTLSQGLGQRIVGPVHPSKSYYANDLPLIDVDLESAKTLLAEAGWEDADQDGTLDKVVDGERQDLSLDYVIVPTSELQKGMFRLIKANADKVGIAINQVQQDARTLFGKTLPERDYQIYSAGAGSDPLDDDFYQLWHTNSNNPSGGNRVQFGNAETDALVEQIRSTVDAAERMPLYKEFQRIIYEEQPMIFLFAPKNRVMISKRFDAAGCLVRPGYDLGNFKIRQ